MKCPLNDFSFGAKKSETEKMTFYYQLRTSTSDNGMEDSTDDPTRPTEKLPVVYYSTLSGRASSKIFSPSER